MGSCSHHGDATHRRLNLLNARGGTFEDRPFWTDLGEYRVTASEDESDNEDKASLKVVMPADLCALGGVEIAALFYLRVASCTAPVHSPLATTA